MIRGLGFVMLHVDDIPAARAFFVDQLGLAIEDETPGFLQFQARDGVAMLGVGLPPPGVAEGTELWWYVDDVDATHADLLARGVRVVNPPADEPFGRTFAVQGPGGHTIYFLQPAPRG